ncbi:flavodoxin family protein [Lacticaseibacillus jixiensis]|uniref:flavodoxin family protein n=1 Tax=Lacticaseibacillus jixiensis TaxID=3231926 RepID=UPI0036F2F6EA
MQWGFINGSPNANGHTAKLGRHLLADQAVTEWPLVNYHLNQLGQHADQVDDFANLIHEIAQVDALLIGTPVYWSDMTGLLKTWLDRCTLVKAEFTKPIKLYALIDGTQAPAQTAPGIAPAIQQLGEFLNMTYQTSFIIDTSIVKRPSDYPQALAAYQEALHD